MPGRNNACPDCDGWPVRDGKCRTCYGSGCNPHLNSLESVCRFCQGDGVCPSCRGTGLRNWTFSDLNGGAQRRGYFGAAAVAFFAAVAIFSSRFWPWAFGALPLGFGVFCVITG